MYSSRARSLMKEVSMSCSRTVNRSKLYGITRKARPLFSRLNDHFLFLSFHPCLPHRGHLACLQYCLTPLNRWMPFHQATGPSAVAHLHLFAKQDCLHFPKVLPVPFHYFARYSFDRLS